MDIYRAVFQAKPDEIAVARDWFIQQHGQIIYDQVIQPYIKDGEPGFLFHATFNGLVWQFIDRLAQYKAWKTGEEYTPPPMFMAYVEIETPTEACTICGIIVDQRIGYKDRVTSQPICYICHRKQDAEKMQEWEESFKQSLDVK